jgi:hypothetical protein
MSAWIGFVIVVSLIVLIGLTLRIHAEAEQRSRRRQKPSPDGGTPENIHYFPSGNDLWGRCSAAIIRLTTIRAIWTEVTAWEAGTARRGRWRWWRRRQLKGRLS